MNSHTDWTHAACHVFKIIYNEKTKVKTEMEHLLSNITRGNLMIARARICNFQPRDPRVSHNNSDECINPANLRVASRETIIAIMARELTGDRGGFRMQTPDPFAVSGRFCAIFHGNGLAFRESASPLTLHNCGEGHRSFSLCVSSRFFLALDRA